MDTGQHGRTRTNGAVVCAVLFALLLTRAPGDEPRFRVHPYLIDVGQTEAVVAFQLHAALPATLRLFDAADGTETARVDAEAKLAHSLLVKGLMPGRTYRYEVDCGNGTARTPPGDPSYAIRTSGSHGDSFRFAVYGDPRPGDTGTDRHHRAVISQIEQHDPMFALVLGDMVDDGTERPLWERFMAIESPLARRAALYPVLGDNDHVAGTGRAPQYFPRLAKGYYHFEWNGVHFFALSAWDARGRQPRRELDENSAQLRWLQAQLARPEVRAAPFRVVFTHDPVRISRGRPANILIRKWAPVFEQYRVDLVFASWHMYERSHHRGVWYIISGGAGAELLFSDPDPGYPADVAAERHHFCRVDVAGDSLTLTAIAEDGAVLDSLALRARSVRGRAAASLQRRARTLRRVHAFSGGASAPELNVRLFSHTCLYCNRLLRDLLPAWAREHNVSLRVDYYDLALAGTYGLLTAIETDFGRQGLQIPAVFIGRTALGGKAEIGSGMPAELRAFGADPDRYLGQAVQPFARAHDVRDLQVTRFRALTAGIVLFGGLVDGINPCAFTAIVFLLSYLALVGTGRRQMVWTGASFSMGVFLTYLLLGLLVFRMAALLNARRALARLLNAGLFAAVCGLAVLSALDTGRALRGHARQSLLRLPQRLDALLRARIRGFARHPTRSAAAALVLGTLIALLELACTGQVYLPVVTMLANPRFRAHAFLYLLLYNVAFVVPLVAVFLLAILGITSERMARFARAHVAAAKLGMTVLFVVLAAVLLYNMAYL